MNDKYEKEFRQTIQKIAGKYSVWQVWNDFLYMASVSCANCNPLSRDEEREKKYLETIQKYSKEEQMLFPELFAYLVLSYEENSKQDFLGKMYHDLKLHQKQKGQFFTPYHIAQFMALTQSDDAERIIREKGYISVNDPACGSGVMLIAYANEIKEKGINFQTQVLFVAQDIDQTAALMCYLQLSLLGCSAIVIIGDSLIRPGFHPDNQVWYTPMYTMNYWRFSKTCHEVAMDEETRNVTMYDTMLSVEQTGQFVFNFDSVA